MRIKQLETAVLVTAFLFGGLAACATRRAQSKPLENNPCTNMSLPESGGVHAAADIKLTIDDQDWFLVASPSDWSDDEQRVGVTAGTPEPGDGQAAFLVAHNGYHYGTAIASLEPGDTIRFNHATYNVRWRKAVDKQNDPTLITDTMTVYSDKDAIYLQTCLEDDDAPNTDGWVWWVYAEEFKEGENQSITPSK